jgi:hypothetical protein
VGHPSRTRLGNSDRDETRCAEVRQMVNRISILMVEDASRKAAGVEELDILLDITSQSINDLSIRLEEALVLGPRPGHGPVLISYDVYRHRS